MPEDDNPEEIIDFQGPVCPVCSAPLEDDFDFCPFCDAPLTMSATLDPVHVTRSAGEVMRVGMASPSLLFVAGGWVLFLSYVILSVMGIIRRPKRSFPSYFWGSIASFPSKRQDGISRHSHHPPPPSRV